MGTAGAEQLRQRLAQGLAARPVLREALRALGAGGFSLVLAGAGLLSAHVPLALAPVCVLPFGPAAICAYLGAAAGYVGGVFENLIMRVCDIFSSIPSVLMAIAVVSALGKSTFNLMLAVGIASTAPFIRVARAAVLTVRGEEYVESARAIGSPEWKIVAFHILPNCVSQIIVQATLRVGSAIISAAQLSFLGLGVAAPAPEWGSMLSAGRAYIRDYSYMTLFPGIAIMLTVLSLNLIGDGLRDALDPKLKR